MTPRVQELLARLTLREKIGQLNQNLPGWDALHVVDGEFVVTDALKREVEQFGGIGSLYGLQRADPWSGRHWGNGIPPQRSAEATAVVQDYVVENSSSGLPTLFVEEAPHGLQGLGGHVLPVNLAVGAAWDDDLVAELAALVAAELRVRGIHVALLSGLDVLRDPRWGRAEECFSEDPLLAARSVRAAVSAMQGAAGQGSAGQGAAGQGAAGLIDDAHVAVVVKHLAAQGAGTGGRNGSGAPLGGRELHEIHLPAARAAADAGVAGFMAAYNDVDGIACSANRDLLTGVLREDWGWDGIVMADCTALDRLLDAAPDHASAGALALRAGVDVSFWDRAYVVLGEAVERGLVDVADVDRACARVLGLKERLGLLGGPTPAAVASAAPDPARADGLARRLARESVVLLRNSGVLPLDPGTRLAVVGPNSDDLLAQLGDYTAPRPTPDPGSSTVRTALEARGFPVVHAAGSRLREPLEGGLAAVRAAVADSDVAVVVLGGSSRRLYDSEFAENGAVQGADLGMTNGEGVDLSRVGIDPVQLEVAQAAREAGRPVVGVVIGGRPHVVTEFARLCDALLFAAFPGPTGGDALADVLSGAESPSGRLPVTLPGGEGVFPVAHDERLETSRGYADASYADNVLLGTGSSYTTFETAIVGTTGDEVRVRVRNTGERASRVVVPLFGRRHVLGIRPRVRQVLDHAAVHLDPGAETELVLHVGDLARGYVDVWVSGDLHPPAAAVRVAGSTGVRDEVPE